MDKPGQRVGQEAALRFIYLLMEGSKAGKGDIVYSVMYPGLCQVLTYVTCVLATLLNDMSIIPASRVRKQS